MDQAARRTARPVARVELGPQAALANSGGRLAQRGSAIAIPFLFGGMDLMDAARELVHDIQERFLLAGVQAIHEMGDALEQLRHDRIHVFLTFGTQADQVHPAIFLGSESFYQTFLLEPFEQAGHRGFGDAGAFCQVHRAECRSWLTIEEGENGVTTLGSAIAGKKILHALQDIASGAEHVEISLESEGVNTFITTGVREESLVFGQVTQKEHRLFGLWRDCPSLAQMERRELHELRDDGSERRAGARPVDNL